LDTKRKKDPRLLATKSAAALRNPTMISLISMPLAATVFGTGGMPGGGPGGTGGGAGGTGGITTTGGDKVVKEYSSEMATNSVTGIADLTLK